MKKLINDPRTVVDESVEGFGLANADLVAVHADPRFITRKDAPVAGKVGLVSGGGSGHEPLHAGFVGMGMLDAAVPGAVFTSPTPDQILPATQAADSGAGVVQIVKNYTGDVLNFETAAELAEAEGVQVRTVLVNDDVAVEDSTYTTGRRGVAGTLVVEKIVGAAAEQGRDLAGLKALGDRVNGATRSMGVALTSCTVPAAGKPLFVIGDDEMEFGVGIHGEPGRRRDKLMSADAIAEEICGAIAADFGLIAGKPALLFVNGFGATPAMELYLMYNAARRLFEQHGVRIERSLVGNYVTSLDMAGCSITLSILDEDTTKLWDAPVHTAALRW